MRVALIAVCFCFLPQLVITTPHGVGHLGALNRARKPLPLKKLTDFEDQPSEEEDQPSEKEERTQRQIREKEEQKRYDKIEEEGQPSEDEVEQNQAFQLAKEKWSYTGQVTDTFDMLQQECATPHIGNCLLEKVMLGKMCLDVGPNEISLPTPEQEEEFVKLYNDQLDIFQKKTSLLSMAASLEKERIEPFTAIGLIISASGLLMSLYQWISGSSEETKRDNFILHDSIQELIGAVEATNSSMTTYKEVFVIWLNEKEFTEDGYSSVIAQFPRAKLMGETLARLQHTVQEATQALCQLASSAMGEKATGDQSWKEVCSPSRGGSDSSLALEVTAGGALERKQFGICCILVGMLIGGAIAGAGAAGATAASSKATTKAIAEEKESPPDKFCQSHLFQRLSRQLRNGRLEIATIFNGLNSW